MKDRLIRYAQLFAAFFKIGLFTFGGGMSMLPMLQRELVESKQWLTEEEILNYFAIGQCTPGIIAVNVATFCGYKRAGLSGAIVSTIGMVCPSWIVITLIAGSVSRFSDIAWIQRAMKGIYVAVAALLARAVFTFGHRIYICKTAYFKITRIDFYIVCIIKLKVSAGKLRNLGIYRKLFTCKLICTYKAAFRYGFRIAGKSAASMHFKEFFTDRFMFHDLTEHKIVRNG